MLTAMMRQAWITGYKLSKKDSKSAPSDPTEGTKLNLLNQIEHLKLIP